MCVFFFLCLLLSTPRLAWASWLSDYLVRNYRFKKIKQKLQAKCQQNIIFGCGKFIQITLKPLWNLMFWVGVCDQIKFSAARLSWHTKCIIWWRERKKTTAMVNAIWMVITIKNFRSRVRVQMVIGKERHTSGFIHLGLVMFGHFGQSTRPNKRERKKRCRMCYEQ